MLARFLVAIAVVAVVIVQAPTVVVMQALAVLFDVSIVKLVRSYLASGLVFAALMGVCLGRDLVSLE